MELTHTKKTRFITSIVLSLLLCAMILFAGCNPETPPPANQITIEQMQASLLNFGQKVENLTNYTDEATPARTPEANEISEIGLPYSLYKDIDFKFEYTNFNNVIEGTIVPIINFFNNNEINLSSGKIYINNSNDFSIVTFGFDNTTNTLITNFVQSRTHDNQIYYSYGKISIKLTENDWISMTLQLYSPELDEGAMMHINNDMSNINPVKSCYMVQYTPITYQIVVIAIDFDTKKWFEDISVLTETQLENIYNTYIEPCKELDNEH